MTTPRRSSSLLAFASMLAACGGQGSGDGSDTAASTAGSETAGSAGTSTPADTTAGTNTAVTTTTVTATTGPSTADNTTDPADTGSTSSDTTDATTGDVELQGCENGADFAAVPTSWAIPFPAASLWDGGSVIDWRPMDMDGDGVLDMELATGGPPVGVSEWAVYPGGMGGFAAVPTAWAIPFPATSVLDGGSVVDWTTMDIDGDGVMDLLNANGLDPVGVTQWEAYFGGPGGFDVAPSAWAIPFPATSVFDGGSVVDWTTMDIDGDGWVDLLNANGLDPVGVTQWEAYFGGPGGFDAAPSVWAIPFPATSVFDGGSVIDWTTRDADGDGWVDLINANGVDPVGVSEWEVYFGGPGGFAAVPSPWAIPFPALSVFDGGTVIDWGILDVNGDGIIDMVLANGIDPVGVTEWSVWFGECK